MKPTVYFDVDQVLIANERNASNYAPELIKYVVERYDTVWLTTHCMDGNANTPIEHIGHLFDAETVAYMRRIRGARWTLLKTEAIDFSKPFIWLDDDCMEEEREILMQHNCLANWVEINLFENENELKDLLFTFPVAVRPMLPPISTTI